MKNPFAGKWRLALSKIRQGADAILTWFKVNSRLAVESAIAFALGIALYMKMSGMGDFLGNLPFGKSAIYVLIAVVVALLATFIWKKSSGSSGYNLASAKKVGGFLGGLFKSFFTSGLGIGILSCLLITWLWWTLDPSSLMEALQTRVYWPIITVIIFVAIISRTILGLGILVAILVGASSFFKGHSPTSNSGPTSQNGVAVGNSSSGNWGTITGPEKDYIQGRFGVGNIFDKIAACESGYTQYSDPVNKVVLRNPASSAMGVFQIMESWHRREADSLGIDLTTVEGNSNFAEWLYNHPNAMQSPSDPWNESKRCWGEEFSPVNSSNTLVIGPLDTTIVLEDTTAWGPKIPVGGPSHSLSWLSEKDAYYLIRWGKGSIIVVDTMVPNECKTIAMIPEWVQARALYPADTVSVRFKRQVGWSQGICTVS